MKMHKPYVPNMKFRIVVGIIITVWTIGAEVVTFGHSSALGAILAGVLGGFIGILLDREP